MFFYFFFLPEVGFEKKKKTEFFEFGEFWPGLDWAGLGWTGWIFKILFFYVVFGAYLRETETNKFTNEWMNERMAKLTQSPLTQTVTRHL